MAAPAAAAAPPMFGPEPSIAQRQAIKASIENGTHVAPLGWAALQMSPAQTNAAIPQAVKDFASSSKRYLIGVSYADVLAEFYKALAIARQVHNPIQLLRDMILSVYVTYTLSSSWSPSYTAFMGASMFAAFDIAGRTAKNGIKDAWVAASTMNSTSIHLLGYMIVEHAPVGSLLAKVKAQKGTPWSLTTGEGEQAKIMKEHATNLTPDDTVLKTQFGAEAARAIAIVSALFGAAGADVNAALAAANRFAGEVI